MGIVTILLMVVEVICSLLLMGVILLQKSKNEGMGGVAFGSGMGESLFGSRAGNILTKTTVILSCVFIVNTALLGVLISHGKTGDSEGSAAREAVATGQTQGGQPPAGP